MSLIRSMGTTFKITSSSKCTAKTRMGAIPSVNQCPNLRVLPSLKSRFLSPFRRRDLASKCLITCLTTQLRLFTKLSMSSCLGMKSRSCWSRLKLWIAWSELSSLIWRSVRVGTRWRRTKRKRSGPGGRKRQKEAFRREKTNSSSGWASGRKRCRRWKLRGSR